MNKKVTKINVKQIKKNMNNKQENSEKKKMYWKTVKFRK